jgi:type VI protein secretion system component Hcp
MAMALSFKRAQSAIGDDLVSLAVADLNGDGTLDIATVNQRDGTINLTIPSVNDPPTPPMGPHLAPNMIISGSPPSSDVQSPNSALTSSLVPNGITEGNTPLSQPLTYLLRVDGVTGDSTIKGYEGWFTVDEHTFAEFTQLATRAGGIGGGAGKAQFDPLTVDLSGLPVGLVTLLHDAVTGQHIKSIELAGLKLGGESGPSKVYDLTLNNVTVAGYAADGGHDTALAFDYRSGTETIQQQRPDGSNASQSFTFDLAHNGGSITPVNHDALAAFAHSHLGHSGSDSFNFTANDVTSSSTATENLTVTAADTWKKEEGGNHQPTAPAIADGSAHAVPTSNIAPAASDATGNGTQPGVTTSTASASPAATATNGDTFVFAANFGNATVSNFHPATDVIEIDHSVFANFQALLTATHDDGHGNAVITADPHDTITIKNVTVAQLVQYHDNFHFT